MKWIHFDRRIIIVAIALSATGCAVRTSTNSSRTAQFKSSDSTTSAPTPTPSATACVNCDDGDTEEELLAEFADCVEVCGGTEVCNCDAIKAIQFF